MWIFSVNSSRVSWLCKELSDKPWTGESNEKIQDCQIDFANKVRKAQVGLFVLSKNVQIVYEFLLNLMHIGCIAVAICMLNIAYCKLSS